MNKVLFLILFGTGICFAQVRHEQMKFIKQGNEKVSISSMMSNEEAAIEVDYPIQYFNDINDLVVEYYNESNEQLEDQIIWSSDHINIKLEQNSLVLEGDQLTSEEMDKINLFYYDLKLLLQTSNKQPSTPNKRKKIDDRFIQIF